MLIPDLDRVALILVIPLLLIRLETLPLHALVHYMTLSTLPPRAAQSLLAQWVNVT